jgi:hypothetical protein
MMRPTAQIWVMGTPAVFAWHIMCTLSSLAYGRYSLSTASEPAEMTCPPVG